MDQLNFNDLESDRKYKLVYDCLPVGLECDWLQRRNYANHKINGLRFTNAHWNRTRHGHCLCCHVSFTDGAQLII